MARRTLLTLLACAAGLTCSTAISAAETITYTYDARGRLIKVIQVKDGDDRQTCYRYDKADNRTNVKTDISSPPPCP